MKNGLLDVSEVCALVGCSIYTLDLWYKFKRENPDNEYAVKLPDIKHIENDKKRYWQNEDIWKLIEFKASIPHGKNGVLGNVTQRYKKKGKNNNGKKKINN